MLHLQTLKHEVMCHFMFKGRLMIAFGFDDQASDVMCFSLVSCFALFFATLAAVFISSFVLFIISVSNPSS